MDYNWPEITTETTMEKLQEIHKRIWQYVIENGYKPDTPYTASCAACEYAFKVAEMVFPSDSLRHMCDCCPAIWVGDIETCCYHPLSPYDRWYNARLFDHKKEQKIYAAMVRDVEFKKEEREDV